MVTDPDDASHVMTADEYLSGDVGGKLEHVRELLEAERGRAERQTQQAWNEHLGFAVDAENLTGPTRDALDQLRKTHLWESSLNPTTSRFAVDGPAHVEGLDHGARGIDWISWPTPSSWRASPPRRASAPCRSPTLRRRHAAPRGPRARARRTRPPGAGRRSRGGASRSGTCIHTAGPHSYHQGNIRTAGAFRAADRLRSFAMEHIVLEYDESTRTALVVATSGGREPVLSGHASPYIVADGYDFESRSWGAGHYFTDIAEAKIDYERSCRHPYPLAEGKLRDDEFCTIRWCREDVAAALSEYLAYPIPATEKNIDTAIGQLMFRDGLQDRSTEDGWDTISAIIDEDELDFGISTAQGVDFYKEAFDLSTCTDAVIWPSGDGNAAFVMAYPADSDDGDLAVYKIGGGLIGDDEITVEDIEGLGGTRELCVYKHGFDGIEAIRDFANRTAVCKFDERVVVRDPIGAMPDLGPTLRNTAVLDEWDARLAMQQPRDPQGIAAAALTAAEGGTKAVAEHGGNKH